MTIIAVISNLWLHTFTAILDTRTILQARVPYIRFNTTMQLLFLDVHSRVRYVNATC